jgi:hypothetical protein
MGAGGIVEAYVDEGISGNTTNRPAFQGLIRDIELKIQELVRTDFFR